MVQRNERVFVAYEPQTRHPLGLSSHLESGLEEKQCLIRAGTNGIMGRK